MSKYIMRPYSDVMEGAMPRSWALTYLGPQTERASSLAEQLFARRSSIPSDS
jgi:hypothetical protein